MTNKQALIEQDANLAALYDNIGFLSNASVIGLVITDMDGTVIAFNKMIQDLFGLSKDKPKSVNVSTFYAHPEDRKRLFQELSRSGNIRDFEVEIKPEQGTPRTVSANVDVIEWNGKRALLTSLFDVTQYKQQFQKDEKSYKALFSNVPVGISVTDFYGNVLVTNKAVRDLLGYSEEELKNVNMQAFYSVPADRDQFISMLSKLGYIRNFETVLRRRDGGMVTVLINSDVIEYGQRKDILLTSLRDISDHKRVEDELIRERDFSSTILSIATTLIVVLDSEGRITRYNRACERISEYPHDEVVGKRLWDIGFFDPPLTGDQIGRLLKQGYQGIFDTTVVSRTGVRHTVSWTFATILSREEKLEFIVATGVDTTERRKAEAELQRTNRELASRVEELQERTEEMRELNEMGEQLQSCQTVSEVCTVSGQYIQKICPYSHGALYLINEERKTAEVNVMWGTPAYTREEFDPMDCWAIRRGHQHMAGASFPGLLCGHVTGPKTGQYLCVPLLVNGRAIGILHLNHVEDESGGATESKPFSYEAHRAQIVTTIAEHIALALSNLELRNTLRQQAIRDPLTGLYNRRYMEESLRRELKRAQRENLPVAVVMFDIDHFKLFNDTAGHDAGDALLHELGALLMNATRGEDIVCRYGGEEFLAVLPGTNKENALQHAEKLRREAGALTVYHQGKALPRCTISLGVAVYPDNGTEGETLLKAADNALYRAKEAGRDRVEQA